MGSPRLCVKDFDHPTLSVHLVGDGIPLVIWAVVCSIAFADIVSSDHVRGSKVLLEIDRAKVAQSQRPFCDGIHKRAPDARMFSDVQLDRKSNSSLDDTQSFP